MLTFVIISAKVISKNSLVACSMVQIITDRFSFPTNVSLICHKEARGEQSFFQEDLDDCQEEKRLIMSIKSLVLSLLSRLKITCHPTCHYL